MNVNVTNDGSICRVGLDGEMNIYHAAKTKESLLSAMAACSEIEINLAHVSEIDASGLQLLALVKREAADSNKPVHFVAHSPAVLELLDLCNLAGVFGDPVVISPARS